MGNQQPSPASVLVYRKFNIIKSEIGKVQRLSRKRVLSSTQNL